MGSQMPISEPWFKSIKYQAIHSLMGFTRTRASRNSDGLPVFTHAAFPIIKEESLLCRINISS